MSKEIEEMTKIMCKDAGTKNCNIRCNAKPICDVHFYAERLYNEGYRKQSESVIDLPCKVGDIVWVCNYNNGKVYENRVDGIYITGASGWKNTLRLKYKNHFGEVQYRKFAWKQIGKIVFFTREEAEQTLKHGE